MTPTQQPAPSRAPLITARQIQFADHWHLVRVAANRVFDTASLLRKMRLTVYAPLQTYNRRVGRNRAKVVEVEAEHPAFFNYMFVGFRRREDWWVMFETELVRAIVVIGGKPAAFTQGEIASIARRQLSGEFDFRGRAMAAAFEGQPGDRVKVVNDRHCLYGREYVVQTVTDGRVGVLIDFLGKKQFYELAVDDVAKSK